MKSLPILLLSGIFLILVCPLETPAFAQCPGAFIGTAGIADDFAGIPEPTDPSNGLVQYAEKFWPQLATRMFDDEGIDRALIHTFTGWKGRVCGATLEIGLRGEVSSLTTNDSVRLQLKGGANFQEAFLYWTTIRFVTGAWGPDSTATLVLDLGDLPPYGGFPTDILSSLNKGSLDLLVEDDTTVDYAELTVCPCKRTISTVTNVSWGNLKARYVGTETTP